MILYHGSNVEVREPRIINTNRGLDFGAAFYATSDLEQAIRWAALKVRRKGSGIATVSVFEWDDHWATDGQLVHKHFETADADWLDYVAANRKGLYKGRQYDVVSGPVANDKTILVVNDYLSGAVPYETAILLLRTAQLKDQYAFLTFRGIQTLRFKEVMTHVG